MKLYHLKQKCHHLKNVVIGEHYSLASLNMLHETKRSKWTKETKQNQNHKIKIFLFYLRSPFGEISEEEELTLCIWLILRTTF